MKKIYWLDIVTLKVIYEYSLSEGHPPTRMTLWSSASFSLINDWLRVNKVHPIFCDLVKSNGSPSKSIRNLRDAGFLPPEARSEYFITKSGINFLGNLSSDYRQWPIVACLRDNGEVDFHQSVYAIDGILSVRINHG